MDKRLIKLLQTRGNEIRGGQMLDTYNQQIQDGVSCTIRTNINTANHHFIVEQPKVIVYDDYNQNIPKNQSVIGTITTNIGSSTPRNGIKLIEVFEPICVAMRGRNPNNPSERAKSNGKYIQRLEMNENETSNTITSVQKDNLVVEPNIVEDWQTIVGNKQLNPFRGSVEGTSPCITSACGAGGGMTPMLTDADLETTKTKEFIEQVRGHEEMRYRIRKLTPRECFRLMGVDDADIDKLMSAGISNSQLYKCAGNSIVVDTLYHLFRKLFCDKESEEATYQQTLF